MKKLLIIISILISTYGFGQGVAKKETVDTVARLTNDTPLLTLSDLDKVLLSLDDKLLNKDHKVVTLALQAAIIEAEKRRNKIKK